jgi:hypothetical protein
VKRAIHTLAVLLAGSIAAMAYPRAALADDTKACLDAANQGQTLRDGHKMILAREQFRLCAQATCPAVVRKDCASWLDQLDLVQPTVVFDATDSSGNDVSAATVKVDGRVLTSRLDGTALAVDPGEHTFTFEAPGQPTVTRTLVLKEGESMRRVPVLIGAAAERAPVAPPMPAAGTSPLAPTPSPAPPHPTGLATRQTIGLVVGAAGVAGLAAGGIFGVLAVSAKNDYQRQCGSNIDVPAGFCNSQGVNGHDDAATKATLSTAFFIGGAVAAGLGTVLFLLPTKDSAAQAGLAPGSILVRGRF